MATFNAVEKEILVFLSTQERGALGARVGDLVAGLHVTRQTVSNALYHLRMQGLATRVDQTTPDAVELRWSLTELGRGAQLVPVPSKPGRFHVEGPPGEVLPPPAQPLRDRPVESNLPKIAGRPTKPDSMDRALAELVQGGDEAAPDPDAILRAPLQAFLCDGCRLTARSGALVVRHGFEYLTLQGVTVSRAGLLFDREG